GAALFDHVSDHGGRHSRRTTNLIAGSRNACGASSQATTRVVTSWGRSRPCSISGMTSRRVPVRRRSGCPRCRAGRAAALVPLIVGLLLVFVAYGRWQVAPHGAASEPAALRSA